ncbi:Gfo/Idh/MocA family oxidoreductase [Sphingomonas lacunae]|uniref:Gfo/Idh/MocA family oxidoreductase n=1 Tax=Sphingomonas lacunae TaxID=2698828 RepID=A0A6M4AUG4_9SPHN|nr:Gfo/Idh/MocA family oxidoreductase [Sphingomonas lacunae]QJQ32778.1 Gfo/Idh/MocA family oxidoreductase [Sphingomonas lacunae]
MSDPKLKIGIVGAGRMGITHQCIINTHPEVEVVAVADPSALVTKMLAKYAGVKTHKDYRTMLDKEQLDAVLLCTPPAINHEVLQAVHAKRLHAFVEKPFALNPAHGAELAAMFDGAGLVNQVGYVNRFNDMFVKAREIARSGLLGRPLRFRSEMYSSTIVGEQGEEGWRATHASGGGAMYEMASHAIDLINYMFGKPDKVAGTCLTKVWSKQVEDIVAGSYLYDNGLTGSIYVNWSDESFRKPTNKIEVFGTCGKLQADQHGMKLFLTKAAPELGYEAGWNQVYITDVFSNVPFYLRGIEFTAQLYHFIDCIRGRAAQRCSFADGAAALGVIHDMFRDAAALEAGLGHATEGAVA